jgi:hypothetical protein
MPPFKCIPELGAWGISLLPRVRQTEEVCMGCHVAAEVWSCVSANKSEGRREARLSVVDLRKPGRTHSYFLLTRLRSIFDPRELTSRQLRAERVEDRLDETR